MNSTVRYSAEALQDFAKRLLIKLGMEEVKAQAVASTLVDGDLMGHDTHGLALLPGYIGEIERASMTCSGEPEVLSDRGASLLWDGRRLPGPWLVWSGIETLAPRAREYGSATLVIRRSHHIACLASYLEKATADGFMILLSSSDPAVQSVAPHGGTRSVFTPNPIAAGIPTSDTPFLIDISASTVTNGMTARRHKAGEHFEEACFLDAKGQPTGDPGVLSTEPPGSILPVGGMTWGHKGFGLALLIEAMTGGLAGHGRADPADGWGATVFLSLYDPAAFGGQDAFARQMDWLGDACRSNPPRPGTSAVRMPGDRGLSLKREQLRDGITLHPTIPPALEACAQRHGIALPAAC
ncbi:MULTISPECIES: Ldh family oxidoreductase [Caballeronia]|uniref:Lactate dehydrogenase n=1 Tax=Caballeronia zhejiangensis TaxID=871203 RepID=A0A656Q844_9BURK|nr:MULTISPECIES: Ldh family oxidoreductase [Caballeronia]EKS71714.1 malate/L-lactate dehydrogenase [Burkholderia sp. SJ98]KDR24867.1 lactate dehydrogenase [Caballeronia zhejiangensis]